MKGLKALRRRNYAVNEVIGGILLIAIAIVAFFVISPHLYPELSDVNISPEIKGEVTRTGEVVLYHDGGPELTEYHIYVSYSNGTLIGSSEVKGDNWVIGQQRYPLRNIIEAESIRLITEKEELNIVVKAIDKKGSFYNVFSGNLRGLIKIYSTESYYGDTILISSLRTNTTDEDLICFNNTIRPNISAKTYIYNWIVDNKPLASILMPFDTNSNDIVKDYSGNDFNGTIKDATWASNGIVGGAYYFDGGGDRIDIDLPEAFHDLSTQDFTLSVWINSNNTADNQRLLLEGATDNTNFFRIYQHAESLNFGVRVDNTNYIVKTTILSSNTWYHIVAVWDASEKDLAIYTNGIKSTIRGEGVFDLGVKEGLTLGTATTGNRFWHGYIDEFQLYDKILSEKQIYQMYLCVRDGKSDRSVIVSEETLTGQIWKCIITPNDGVQDDAPVESNSLKIINYGGGK
jgi:hypothetical protein